jgi:uncharacterized protein (TIGR00255 family)
MIKSMTGYGFSASEDEHGLLSVEVKSLNSKFLDLNVRLPRLFSDRELEVRSLVSERLERGKISVHVEYNRKANANLRQVCNEELFVRYYMDFKKLADRVMAPYDSLFQLALNAPDVLQNPVAEMATDAEFALLRRELEKAMTQCDTFRTTEGTVLEQEFRHHLQAIRSSLEQVEQLDGGRLERLRERMRNQVVMLMGEESFDRNRLEQELLYYAEKLDIREECIRLSAHLDYFLRTLGEVNSGGKKLTFIAQEMGREINTIGSKASDASIQQVVVRMKEDLEKIKEQLANVL